MNRLIKPMIIAAILIIPTVCGCAHESENKAADLNNPVSSIGNSHDLIYWSEDGFGVQTNDYLRLQKEVPFKIILPTYLMDELKDYRPSLRKHNTTIQDYSNSKFSEENVIEVSINYHSFSDHHANIFIFENNSSFQWPEQPDTFTLWEYLAINILESSTLNNDFAETGQPNTPEYDYLWYRNNIRFDIRIIGYNQIESRKIIESMFN